tara:strand:+ start:15 stop:374 length:360 start_codon:yes stop_codon:yes gene_type:complete
MKVSLIGNIGKSCVALDDGLKLHNIVLPIMIRGETVELDFNGVDTIYTPFLTGCIGKLFEHFDKNTLMERLVFCQIESTHLKKINEYIDSIDRRNTAKNERELLADIFDEDGIDSFSGP